MDSTKLVISGGKQQQTNGEPATYKPLSDTDMEDEEISRPSSLLVKEKLKSEADGADEKMLKDEDKTQVVAKMGVDQGDVKNGEKLNGDAKLDIGDLKSEFVGLTKEELMKYANDPFWMRLRWFLFITFWLLWAAMLAGAVLIIYAAPKCNPPPPRTWWQQGPIAEVKSDQNSNNKVINNQDILGHIDKHIKGAIVTIKQDAYADLDESNDVLQFIKEAKRDKNLNVIVELDPTVSDRWFEKSESGVEEFLDYYVWRTGKSSTTSGEFLPPNNWLSPYSNSSWKFSALRKQFYYSPFPKPHLNFRNPNVTAQLSSVIRRLISAGAAGIRLHNAAYLLVDTKYDDEPINPNAVGFGMTQYGFYAHVKTMHVPGVGHLLSQWRRVVANISEEAPFMVTDDLSNNVEAYRFNGSLVVDLPVQKHIFSKPNLIVDETVNSLKYVLNIENVEWPLWVANTTAVSKDVLDIVTYLLPGTPLVEVNHTVNEHLIKIRQTPTAMRGDCKIFGVQNNTVLVYLRETPGNPGILVALNPADHRIVMNIPADIPPLSGTFDVTVQLYSHNYNETAFMDVNKKHDARAIPLTPKSAIVLSYVPPKDEE